MTTSSSGRVLRRARLLVGVALVGVLVAAITALLPHDTDAGFDPAAWRASAGIETGNRRFGMIHDLEANKLRVGMTRDEVRTLLGPAEGSGPDYDSWGLGFAPFVGVDYDTYQVRYGPDGRVSGFGLVRG